MPEGILRVYPPPTREVDAPYADLELPPAGSHDPSLPYVIINMVASVDGRVAEAGKASRLGSARDRLTMRTLRSKADAVMIGAGTLRAERLSLGLDEASSGPQPLGILVANSADVPLETNLIPNAGQEVLVIRLHSDAPTSSLTALTGKFLEVPATPAGTVDLRKALELLKADFAVDVLLVEGGPSLSHALISSHLVDELFLTIAHKLLGGTPEDAPAILDGPALPPANLSLISAYAADNELFLRYRIIPLPNQANSMPTTTKDQL